MFTDIVGYTALAQSNESATIRLLEDHRALIRPIFVSYGGREIKTVGDAFLVEFGSALDATLCAIAVQSALNDRKLARGDKLALRIGIHVGDVVEKEGDVLGDAVNIASRIEPLSEPGGVCVSEQVYYQVKNKVPYPLVRNASRELKNVSEPVDVYKVVMPWEKEHVESAQQLDSKTVAVLPFASMSPDPNDEYFADGLTEELIDRLCQVKELGVIARTSVMNYKKKEKNASQIGKELKAGALVEGSVRKAGNRIRVTAQLIDANTEKHLWSSHYDKDLDDIFAVQSDIAEKVAGELKVQLLDSEKKVIEKRATVDTLAYTYYLRGMQLDAQLGEEPLKNAFGLLEQAVARDPGFARAYAGIALCYNRLASGGYIPFQEAIDKGRVAALKALELDSDLAEAHLSLASIMFMADEDRQCMLELKRALELNPSLVEAYLLFAEESAVLGSTQEMVRAAEKAYQLDPIAPRAISWLGMAYFWTGRGEEAMEHWKRTLHLEPYRTYRRMFDYYVSKGDYEQAEKTVKELERIGPDLWLTHLNRGYLAAITGDTKTAREMIGKLDGMQASQRGYAGYIFLALGDVDEFFARMYAAAGSHTSSATDLRYNPLLEKARKDPRMAEVFRRSGLPYEPQS